MNLQKLSKLLVLPMCLFVVSACSNNQADSGAKKETTEVQESDAKSIVVSTKLGDLSYSDQWDGLMETDVKEEEGKSTVIFKTTLNDKEYPLFTVVIDDEEDGNATIKDANGKKHQVHISMEEIDEEGLSEAETNRLYAMQEEVNYILEQL